MGKLFFYSDQVNESPRNRRLDDVLFANTNTEDIKVTYIPSTNDQEKKYFTTKEAYYRSYGIKHIGFFDLYSEFDSSKMEELLSSDVIHLSAGNPIELSKALKHRKMEKVLFEYFHRGGVIVGVSGGGVQLGKSTKLFQLFTGGPEKDVVEGLKLVDFEFLPHYNRWNDKYKKKVAQYAQSTGTTIYAACDGDGLIVEKDTIHLIGDIVVMNEKVD